jgi:hypothetical protein
MFKFCKIQRDYRNLLALTSYQRAYGGDKRALRKIMSLIEIPHSGYSYRDKAREGPEFIVSCESAPTDDWPVSGAHKHKISMSGAKRRVRESMPHWLTVPLYLCHLLRLSHPFYVLCAHGMRPGSW